MSNKLINEESPYLLQHANNPVNWFPWSQEAFELAKKENKPIFLSIGYSACHWCHVMERESFEDIEIAQKLNENFICIKVDKEERPDIDKHFQEIFIKMNNKAGGWPLSIFMSSKKVPFYSGTYIPPIPNYGLMGFSELLDVISKTWAKDSKMLINKGQEVLNALKPKNKIEATKLTDALIDITIKQIKQVYDKKYGGFGNAPKFPHASTIELTLDLYKLNKDDELKDIVINTLDNMLLGGIYDIVEGGFCRYSVDEQWLVPHFEKMLYDNALMLSVLIKAYGYLNIQRYKDKAIEIANFIIDKMGQDNLYFSSSDADSKGVEGRYFIYDYNEAKEEFEKNGIDSSLLYDLSITKNGNFDGKSIARFSNISLIDSKNTTKALNILKNIRNQREYPFVDKKIITSWNAMFISSLFKLSIVEPRYKDIAISSLKALEKKMLIKNILYHSSLIENKPKIEAFFEDYAYLIDAKISAFQSTLDEIHLIEISNLANEAIRKFYDNGRWMIGDSEFKDFVDDFDSSYPSAVSIMVQNLLTIRSLVDITYEKFAFSTLQVNSYNIMRQPISRPTITNSAIRYIKDDIIIKSKIENLKKIDIFKLNYPYILLKPTINEKFEICNNYSCFASVETIDKVEEVVTNNFNYHADSK